MNEMIERVARAIDPVAFDPSIEDENYPGEIEDNRTAALSRARAAIEAMREPTEGMQKAGFRVNVWENPKSINVGRVTIPADKPWRAMIDEALKPSP